MTAEGAAIGGAIGAGVGAIVGGIVGGAGGTLALPGGGTIAGGVAGIGQGLIDGAIVGAVVGDFVSDIYEMATGNQGDTEIEGDYNEAASEERQCGGEPPNRCDWLAEQARTGKYSRSRIKKRNGVVGEEGLCNHYGVA